MVHGIEKLIFILHISYVIKQNMYWLVVVQWGTTIARLNENGWPFNFFFLNDWFHYPPSENNKEEYLKKIVFFLFF